MAITQEEATRTQAHHENDILDEPGVVSVATVKQGEDWIIEIGVESKKDLVSSSLPSKLPVRDEQGSSVVGREVKVIVAVEGPNYAQKHPSDDGGFEIDASGIYTARKRPCPGGYSMGVLEGNCKATGTYGALAVFNGSFEGYALSNNHVLAATNCASADARIIQPGSVDGGSATDKYTVGGLAYWVPLTSGTNTVDAAVAGAGGLWSHTLSEKIQDIGSIKGEKVATVGMAVEKTGRTTGHTTGTIISVNAAVKVKYRLSDGSTVLYRFSGQIRTKLMSKGGDSGSLLVERSSKKGVGLLFSNGAKYTHYNHIGKVLDALTAERKKTVPGTGPLVLFTS